MLKRLRKIPFLAPKEPTRRLLVVNDRPESEPVALTFRESHTVLEAALANDVEIPTSCGGMGTCGTCRIEILEAPDGFESRNEIEEEFARERGFKPNERLACQITARVGLKIKIPENQSK